MNKQERIDAAPFFEHFNDAHLDDDGVPVARVKLDDAECDPFQVTFDQDGAATVDSGDWSYLLLSPEMIEQMKSLSTLAQTLYEDWFQTASGKAWEASHFPSEAA